MASVVPALVAVGLGVLIGCTVYGIITFLSHRPSLQPEREPAAQQCLRIGRSGHR